MKKLLLSTLLLLSGVAHAELTKEEGAFISALQSADASKLSTAIQDLGASYNINHDWAKEKKKDGKTVKTPVTNFELIMSLSENS